MLMYGTSIFDDGLAFTFVFSDKSQAADGFGGRSVGGRDIPSKLHVY